MGRNPNFWAVFFVKKMNLSTSAPVNYHPAKLVFFAAKAKKVGDRCSRFFAKALCLQRFREKII
jgi:hypothetical protein